MKKKTYRFVALDKYGERRCWAWGSTLKIAEKRIMQAVREYIRMEGQIYGQFKEWDLKWELRLDSESKEHLPDTREYLDKPTKKPPRTRRKITDESAL